MQRVALESSSLLGGSQPRARKAWGMAGKKAKRRSYEDGLMDWEQNCSVIRALGTGATPSYSSRG